MNLTTIIGKVRGITGNKPANAASDFFIDNPDISTGLAPYIRDLNKIYGNSTGRKRVTFSAVANQQEYAFDTYLETGAFEVIDVWRSSSNLPDDSISLLAPQYDPSGNFNGDVLIDPGLQQNVFDTITQQARAELAERFSWEVFNRVLILMPVPTDSAEKIRVEYTTTSSSIETLPDEAEDALISAGVVVVQNLVLNRLPGLRPQNEAHGQIISNQIRLAQQQRDYYEARYRSQAQSLRSN